jgi:hypothetical protein
MRPYDFKKVVLTALIVTVRSWDQEEVSERMPAR